MPLCLVPLRRRLQPRLVRQMRVWLLGCLPRRKQPADLRWAPSCETGVSRSQQRPCPHQLYRPGRHKKVHARQMSCGQICPGCVQVSVLRGRALPKSVSFAQLSLSCTWCKQGLQTLQLLLLDMELSSAQYGVGVRATGSRVACCLLASAASQQESCTDHPANLSLAAPIILS